MTKEKAQKIINYSKRVEEQKTYVIGPRIEKRVSEFYYGNVNAGARHLMLKKKYGAKVGDKVWLREVNDDGSYTGREFEVTIDSVTDGYRFYHRRGYDHVTFISPRGKDKSNLAARQSTKDQSLREQMY